jgi:hypothetical protein
MSPEAVHDVAALAALPCGRITAVDPQTYMPGAQ